MKLEKVLKYAIKKLEEEIEVLELDLETKEYIPLQRNALEKKLGNLRNDLTEFKSVSI